MTTKVADAYDGRKPQSLVDEENNTNNSYIQFTLRDVALCPDCWLVGGKGGVIFSVRHRENLKLLLARRDDGEFINTVNAEEVACEAAF